MSIPEALVLGCNDPVTVGVLFDWILDNCEFEADFWESGWSEGIANYENGSGYGYKNGSGYGYGGYGGGWGYGFGGTYGYGGLSGNGSGCSYNYLTGNGNGFGY